jgi:virginiamycin B lyase
VEFPRRGEDDDHVTAAPASSRDLARPRFRLAVVVVSVVAAAVGSILLATHRSAEKVTTRGVTATLSVPGHPGALAADADGLWLALTDVQTPVRNRPVMRLNVVSGAVEQQIFLGGQATYLAHMRSRLFAAVEHVGGSGSGPSLVVALDWRSGRVLGRAEFPKLVGALAAGGRDLWALQVRPAALLRLDPDTLAQGGAPIGLSEGRALGLAVGKRYVWATAPDAGDVLRVDPSTHSVRREHVGGAPAGIAIASGSVWFADRDTGALGRLDPETLRPVEKPVRLGGEPAWLAPAGRYLFVGDALHGTVSKIDVRSGTAEGPPLRVAPPAKGAPALAVAPAGNSVWVSSFASRTVTRISARAGGAEAHALAAGKVVASIPVPALGGGFAVGEGAVWAMSDATSTLMRIDPKQNAVVARIRLSPGETAAAGDGAVWLTHPNENTLSRIDPRTNTVSATIHVPAHPSGVAVSPGAVWTANVLGPSVTRIDPSDNRIVATIRVGPNRACCSERMGVTARTDAVWVTLPAANMIVLIDPRTNRVAARFKLGHYFPCGPLAAAESAVWSAGASCSNFVTRIDPRTRKITARLAEPHAVGIALAFGSVWVAVFDSGDVDRIDPRTGQVTARLHVGGWPVRLGVGFGSVWVNDDKGRVLRIRPQS